MLSLPVILLSLVVISEGLGLPYGREISYILILIVPITFLMYEKIILDRKIFVPKNVSAIYTLFLIFSGVSSIFSLDIYQSFIQMIMYCGLFVSFIYSLNHKRDFESGMKKIIFGLSIFFIIYSAFLQVITDKNWLNIAPNTGLQFVYSKFGSHNHLGDFLVLSIILAFYYLVMEKRKIYYAYLALFIPFFLLSYSRTAYVSLAVTLVFLYIHFLHSRVIKLRSWISVIIISSILTAFLFSIITVREAKFIPVLSDTNEYLTKHLNLNDKYFRAKRVEYFNQAIVSVREKPIFGVGPGNFDLVSKKFTETGQWSFSSHNIFLDILSENGLLAFIFFLFFLVKSFTNMKQFNVYSAIFIAMLFSFQTDYIFEIYSYFFLFFVLMGVVYTKGTK